MLADISKICKDFVEERFLPDEISFIIGNQDNFDSFPDKKNKVLLLNPVSFQFDENKMKISNIQIFIGESVENTDYNKNVEKINEYEAIATTLALQFVDTDKKIFVCKMTDFVFTSVTSFGDGNYCGYGIDGKIKSYDKLC